MTRLPLLKSYTLACPTTSRLLARAVEAVVWLAFMGGLLHLVGAL